MLALDRLRQKGRKPIAQHILKIGQSNKAAILDILQKFDTQSKQALEGKDVPNPPLDLFLRFYFLDRKNDFKSEDRAIIVQHCYAIVRWKLYLGFLSYKPINWQGRLRAYESDVFQDRKNKKVPEEESMPDHVRVSFPKPLFELIRQGHGPEAAIEMCEVSNEQPCLTLRANTIRTTRDVLIKQFSNEFGWNCVPTKFAPNGIRFMTPPNGNLFSTVEFKKGHFEVQDEASQLLAMRVNVKPKQTVVDYCGGSAGKTLAFAPFMHNTGQIYVHDIRKSVLLQAKQRLRRAGVQNAQVHGDKVKLRNLLKGRVDWMLLDVPCTGSGVMRRNPDMKWKFTVEKMQELLKVQQLILDESLSFLRDDKSRIVYCTCSILPEENMMQVARFCDKYGFKIEEDAVFQSFPKSKGMDGFFSATLAPK